jgi:hypothetical protein
VGVQHRHVLLIDLSDPLSVDEPAAPGGSMRPDFARLSGIGVPIAIGRSQTSSVMAARFASMPIQASSRRHDPAEQPHDQAEQ